MKTTLNDLDYQAKEGFEMVHHQRGSLPLFRSASGNQPWDKIVYSVISQGRFAKMMVDPMFEDESTIPEWELLRSIRWALTERLSHDIQDYWGARLEQMFQH